MNKFSGMLVFDGTYFPVGGYGPEIPLIWAIDYETHDIPHAMLVPSENYRACRKFFLDLKLAHYPLRYLVCDGNDSIKKAATDVFSDVIIQFCLKHYLTNISNDLGIKSQDTYKEFFEDVKDIVFNDRLCEIELCWAVCDLYPKYKNNQRALLWLTDIMYKRKELTNYHMFKNAPRTTNLIEAYNSHIKDRFDLFRGFKSFISAKHWLNAYVLYRRLNELKACGKKFKHLNGKCSLKNTLRYDLELPNFF